MQWEWKGGVSCSGCEMIACGWCVRKSMKLRIQRAHEHTASLLSDADMLASLSPYQSHSENNTAIHSEKKRQQHD